MIELAQSFLSDEAVRAEGPIDFSNRSPSPRRKAQPFVKWVGGKRSLMAELLARIPQDIGTYYEPFVGGGALFFEMAPRL